MKRRLHTAAIHLMIYLWVAVFAMFLRCCVVSDSWEFTTPGGWHFEVVTLAGQIRFAFASGWPGGAPFPLMLARQWVAVQTYALGFGARHASLRLLPPASAHVGRPIPVVVTYSLYFVPISLPVALLTAIPAVLYIAARRQHRLAKRRRATGLCATCGYDLRSSAIQCPECGTVMILQSDPNRG